MNTLSQDLEDIKDHIPECFAQVYHFGSSIWSECPGDIDILLVYGDEEDLSHIAAEKQRVLDMLLARFEGVQIDLTTLNYSELAETGFLEKASCVVVRGP